MARILYALRGRVPCIHAASTAGHLAGAHRPRNMRASAAADIARGGLSHQKTDPHLRKEQEGVSPATFAR
jgi:hypothetical protein